MALELSRENGGEHLYLSVYRYYKDLIKQGKLVPGSKMPSLRKCAEELHLSRTTIESAYLQLAADGYILAKAQSGYFVTGIENSSSVPAAVQTDSRSAYRYNLSSSGVDQDSFRFDLWQRYIKSALRQSERLLSYGEPQGESDFREALCSYIRERRNILCSPEDIVVGAGVQSLLQILCPLLDRYHTVSFPTPSFVQGATIFEDHGFEVRYRNKDSGVIYVSPAHMTKWGDLMPVKRRLELIHYASEHHSLIIEDDFENEFVYLQKPTPSIYSLAGGRDVIYIGSFSKLLLPSIRISFMVLPASLRDKYLAKASRYNQTASKTEQIALCQFIRDGHLSAQTRRLKRLYAQKMKELKEAVHQIFGPDAAIHEGAAGTMIGLTIHSRKSAECFQNDCKALGLHVQFLEQKEHKITILLSCSSLSVEDFLPALTELKKAIEV